MEYLIKIFTLEEIEDKIKEILIKGSELYLETSRPNYGDHPWIHFRRYKDSLWIETLIDSSVVDVAIIENPTTELKKFKYEGVVNRRELIIEFIPNVGIKFTFKQI